jgi:hypothetical protein
LTKTRWLIFAEPDPTARNVFAVNLALAAVAATVSLVIGLIALWPSTYRAWRLWPSLIEFSNSAGFLDLVRSHGFAKHAFQAVRSTMWHVSKEKVMTPAMPRNYSRIPLLLLLSAAFVLWTNPVRAENKDRRLAVLIAAPHDGEVAMQNDQSAVYKALGARGFKPQEVLALGGPVSRKLLMALLSEAADRIAKWSDGTVFLAYSGHGTYTGTTVRDAKAALLLPSRESVLWGDVFQALRLPKGVHLAVLADC